MHTSQLDLSDNGADRTSPSGTGTPPRSSPPDTDPDIDLADPVAVAKLDAELAREAFPFGALLECKACKRKQKASVGECVKYFPANWPRCCGVEMKRTEREEWDRGSMP